VAGYCDYQYFDNPDSKAECKCLESALGEYCQLRISTALYLIFLLTLTISYTLLSLLLFLFISLILSHHFLLACPSCNEGSCTLNEYGNATACICNYPYFGDFCTESMLVTYFSVPLFFYLSPSYHLLSMPWSVRV
jgi:hypothetical protein